MPVGELTFRDGSTADLAVTFELAERAMHEFAVRAGAIPAGRELSAAGIRGDWIRRRPLIEFMAAQPGGRYVVCEGPDGIAGYARVVRFDEMEQLTELMVRPEDQGQGIGRRLLELAWPGGAGTGTARVVVATGAPADLSLYLRCGALPASGHWQLRQQTDRYLALRSQEVDMADPAVHVLKRDRAVSEWKRLEPSVVGHSRPALHEFFGRDRTCLAVMDERAGGAVALCWVSSDGEIGPAVAATRGDLAPVVVAALDRVAMTQQPEDLSLYVSTVSWSLLRRLRALGFHVRWTSWVLCSVPLPELDRYVPTRPPHLL